MDMQVLEKEYKIYRKSQMLRLSEKIKKDNSNLRTARCQITVTHIRGAKSPNIPSDPVSYLTLA